MKFDMGRAWDQAIAMLSANRDLILIVAGVFFFLPYLALMLTIPDLATQLPTEPGTDPQVLLDALVELFGRIWWMILLLVVLQWIGSLTLLALLRDSSRPTLAEALKLGLVAFLPYLACQILVSLGIGVSFVLLVGLSAAVSPALGVVVAILLLVVVLYVAVKFMLAMPVVGIERVYNPIAALSRSWKLTKGNSLRLFFFYFLIVLAGSIVAQVIQMIFGLLFAALGGQAQLIGDGVVASLLNAAFSALLLAVLAAAHQQLAGGAAATDA